MRRVKPLASLQQPGCLLHAAPFTPPPTPAGSGISLHLAVHHLFPRFKPSPSGPCPPLLTAFEDQLGDRQNWVDSGPTWEAGKETWQKTEKRGAQPRVATGNPQDRATLSAGSMPCG